MPSWPWSYGSWIYNYLCNKCISPPILWVWIPFRRGVLDTTLCDKVCQWLATNRWFSRGTPVSSTNKTDCHDITEILLKVALVVRGTDYTGSCIYNYIMTTTTSPRAFRNVSYMCDICNILLILFCRWIAMVDDRKDGWNIEYGHLQMK